MDADKYQELAARTLLDKPDFNIDENQVMITWNAMGLLGEAGEIAELVKKGIFHQKGIDRDNFKKELGDVLWYLSALCTNLDLSLGEVMEWNIQKLKARYPDGYSSDRSNFKEGDAE